MDTKRPGKDLYQTLVERHAADLYRFARRCTGDRHAAEDIVQETFCAAWQSIGSLRESEKARAWLFQILRHRYHRWLGHEKKQARETPLSLSASNIIPFDAYDPRAHLEQQDLLQVGINKLNESFKEPFLMFFLLGMTCQEIADVLAIPLGTILSRIHRAKHLLRHFLEGEEELSALPAPPSSDAPLSNAANTHHIDKKVGR